MSQMAADRFLHLGEQGVFSGSRAVPSAAQDDSCVTGAARCKKHSALNIRSASSPRAAIASSARRPRSANSSLVKCRGMTSVRLPGQLPHSMRPSGGSVDRRGAARSRALSYCRSCRPCLVLPALPAPRARRRSSARAGRRARRHCPARRRHRPRGSTPRGRLRL